MTREALIAFVSGALFAVGLGVAGMTNPSKVIGFLDVLGRWDPTLAWVMLGAVGVHMPFALYARKPTARPWLSARFDFPKSTRVDLRLVLGAILFGLGWGASGFCPGPAIVSLVALAPTTLMFVGAMALGMVAHNQTLNRPATPPPATDSVGG